MSALAALGRRDVITVIALQLGASVGTILAYNANIGPAKLPQQIIRLGLNVLLCWFLWRGANWARITQGVLCVLAFMMSGSTLLTVGVHGFAGWLAVAFTGLYFICALMLFARPIRDYCRGA